ncbi:hypothetical protein Gpo141_00008117 [Globisporangium polare]
MATNAQQQEFQERITRAKEAARLASLAVSARGHAPLVPPPPPPQARLPSPGMQQLRPPPPPHAFFPQAQPGVLGSAPRLPLQHLHGAQIPTAQAPTPVPDDVRNRIDRLVEFIQRNGVAFEDTVRQRERDNPSFEFLKPGARFHDYFVWKKRRVCGGGAAPPVPPPFPSPPPPALRPPVTAQAPAAVSVDALLSSMSVGAMAGVCKLARMNGLAPYTPIPQEMLWNTAALPPVEPARLEIRIAEFYRQSASK